MNSPEAPRVLVVDDEQALAGVVGAFLNRAGFETRLCADGLEAVALAREWEPEVIVLDLGLPGLDGLEVCRRVRTFSDCYIVMLTARADEVDKLVGLSIGADDYLTKPFSARELVARVQVLLRRPRSTPLTDLADPPRTFGPLTLHPAARETLLDGRPVELTATEFDILDALSAKPRVAFSRRQLSRAVWGDGWVGDDHLVDVHIAHIRRKLNEAATDQRFIVTVRGHGYRMGTGG